MIWGYFLYFIIHFHQFFYKILSDKYNKQCNDNTKLTGHQNSKQKIQLHLKIKEENNNLKLQNKDLLKQLSKYKNNNTINNDKENNNNQAQYML